MNCCVEPLGNRVLAGVTAIVSSVGPEGLRTVSVLAVLCVSAPLVPVIVIVNCPVGVEPVVLTVRTEVPFPVTEGGLNEPVALAGNPVTDKATVPANALVPAIVTLYVVPEPWLIDCEAGVAVRLKSGVAVGVTVRVVEPVTVPDVAWMVVVPAAMLPANPPLPMLATVVVVEVHVAVAVRFCVLLSE